MQIVQLTIKFFFTKKKMSILKQQSFVSKPVVGNFVDLFIEQKTNNLSIHSKVKGEEKLIFYPTLKMLQPTYSIYLLESAHKVIEPNDLITVIEQANDFFSSDFDIFIKVDTRMLDNAKFVDTLLKNKFKAYKSIGETINVYKASVKNSKNVVSFLFKKDSENEKTKPLLLSNDTFKSPNLSITADINADTSTSFTSSVVPALNSSTVVPFLQRKKAVINPRLLNSLTLSSTTSSIDSFKKIPDVVSEKQQQRPQLTKRTVKFQSSVTIRDEKGDQSYSPISNSEKQSRIKRKRDNGDDDTSVNREAGDQIKDNIADKNVKKTNNSKKKKTIVLENFILPYSTEGATNEAKHFPKQIEPNAMSTSFNNQPLTIAETLYIAEQEREKNFIKEMRLQNSPNDYKSRNILQIRIRNRYLKLIANGKKTKEANIDNNMFTFAKKGDIINFFDADENTVFAEIVDIKKYQNLNEMFKKESIAPFLPYCERKYCIGNLLALQSNSNNNDDSDNKINIQPRCLLIEHAIESYCRNYRFKENMEKFGIVCFSLNVEIPQELNYYYY